LKIERIKPHRGNTVGFFNGRSDEASSEPSNPPVLLHLAEQRLQLAATNAQGHAGDGEDSVKKIRGSRRPLPQQTISIAELQA
jgi:hypothetical protein